MVLPSAVSCRCKVLRDGQCICKTLTLNSAQALHCILKHRQLWLTVCAPVAVIARHAIALMQCNALCWHAQAEWCLGNIAKWCAHFGLCCNSSLARTHCGADGQDMECASQPALRPLPHPQGRRTGTVHQQHQSGSAHVSSYSINLSQDAVGACKTCLAPGLIFVEFFSKYTFHACNLPGFTFQLHGVTKL